MCYLSPYPSPAKFLTSLSPIASQERAWYDNHRASLIPEPDAADILEQVKKGAPPPRARDRGLTVRHLAQFFDTTIYNDFSDGPHVRGT